LGFWYFPFFYLQIIFSMRILLAADSFKDALRAPEVCAAMATGFKLHRPDWELVQFPLADGGEGTMDILIQHLGGERKEVVVQDPLGRKVRAGYGLLDEGRIAMVEMAAASGIQLLAANERNARKTSTYGTGELIRAALEHQPQQLIIGLGGSATNDGGIGMASALGYRFLDREGKPVQLVGEQLGQIEVIDPTHRIFAPGEIPVTVICDVDNPLIGPRGASHTYGPQKGATASDVALLEAGMTHYVGLLQKVFGFEVANSPGAGSAGGMGAACLSYLGATLKPGVALVMELCHFERELAGTDWVITGEGRIDEQTLHGKLISGICALAEKHQVPVLALCGALAADPSMIREVGLQAAFSIAQGPGSLQDALAATANNLAITCAQLAGLLETTAGDS
jgi:glycerate kinase